jgi:SAM-dependent methyltransferase
VFDLIVRAGDLRGRRVLDVGAGTGALATALVEKAGCRVWAVDPSTEMLSVARSRVPASVGLKRGSAESLPFKDEWFERAVLRLVVHVVDRGRALPELRRVLVAGGRLVIATFDPGHFEGFWLNPYLPSLEAVDRARFPEPDVLVRELREAGFAEVAVERLVQTSVHDREWALERLRGRYISTLDLLPEGELEAGIEKAERELPERVEARLEWIVVAAQ